MIPSIELEVMPDFPAYATFGLPDVDEITEEGFGWFRDVWYLGSVSHEEALSVITEERRLANLIDALSLTHMEFEAIARAVEYNDPGYFPDGFTLRHPENREIIEIVGDGHSADPVLDCLEIGVAGLSYALSSVGCITAASCRGHLSDQRWSDRPVVFFAAERPTVHWLTPLVRDSGCGFDDGSDRGQLIVIEAPSISNFMELARRIVEASDAAQPGGGATQEQLW
ncbi:hypothetical protein [Streptomyces lateritius]|uniref:hypothetical protein n=1 Tax=Streptomyces lateritius TaxID=67313 RepID=UPI001675DC0A|nr:hypothetical protein [Streptomyces lateritius]GGT62561.1 hypothetical protein GCM10010272_00670 [Streptomyces lateritius]